MRVLTIYLALLSGLFLAMDDARAADYYWLIANSNYQGTGPTPVAACTAFADADPAYIFVRVDYPYGPYGPDRANCVLFSPSANRNFDNVVRRYGDSCPADTEYNPTSGGCEATGCAALVGQSTPFSLSGVGTTDYMYITPDRKFSAPAQHACINGCSVSTVDQSCQTSSLGPWRCGGTAVYDGGKCGEGTESPDTPTVTESAELEKPASELTTQNQPCNYITQPDGSQTCTSLTVEDHKGQTCGTFNGQVICPEIQPEYDSTQIDTTVTTEDNGDGTTTTTKTDVATVTNCTGTSCNTSTTTNTTINNGGSITGTCTGAQCPTAGNPDGNGDGLGDCVGSCEGSTGPLSLEGMGEGTSFADTLDGYYDRITGSPIASAVTGISMPSNGSCSFPTASTYLFDVDLNFICQNADWLDPLRYVFLAIWAFAAVRVLMSA